MWSSRLGKRFFVLTFLIVFQVVFSDNYENIIAITLPKCGTNCLLKYFRLLGLRGYKKAAELELKIYHYTPRHFGDVDYFFKLQGKKILLVRDLRDMFISACNHVEERGSFARGAVNLSSDWEQLSLDKKVLQVSNYKVNPKHIRYTNYGMNFPEDYLFQIHNVSLLFFDKNNLGIRYEDLSGCRGRKVQLNTMKRINNFIGIEATDEDYQYLMNNLWGNQVIKSATFHKGGMNKWKEMLSKKTKTTLWRLYGKYLQKFGYTKSGKN